jgi:hypothetical protein
VVDEGYGSEKSASQLIGVRFPNNGLLKIYVLQASWPKFDSHAGNMNFKINND